MYRMVWKKSTAMISAALQHDVGWLWPGERTDTCHGAACPRPRGTALAPQKPHVLVPRVGRDSRPKEATSDGLGARPLGAWDSHTFPEAP